MKKTKKNFPKREETKKRLKYRIVIEKQYTENCAEWMVNRIEDLVDHMQYGHALIAYKRQDGEFQLVKATLLYYERTFGKAYALEEIKGGTVVYWDVYAQGWRNLMVENFLEWSPIV